MLNITSSLGGVAGILVGLPRQGGGSSHFLSRTWAPIRTQESRDDLTWHPLSRSWATALVLAPERGVGRSLLGILLLELQLLRL